MWQGVREHGQEAGDSESIFPVGLGFPEGELHEVRDKERIDNDRMVAVAAEEGREVNVIAAGGFQADEDRLLRELGKVFGEFPEAFHIHGGDKAAKLIWSKLNHDFDVSVRHWLALKLHPSLIVDKLCQREVYCIQLSFETSSSKNMQARISNFEKGGWQ